jgi:hypothetical protein
MNPQFKDPNLARFAVDIKLGIRVMTEVFEQSKVFPALRSDRLVSPAGGQRKTVERKIQYPRSIKRLFEPDKVCSPDLPAAV